MGYPGTDERVCSVKRMVWLTDGDCLDISTQLEDEITKKEKTYTSAHPTSFLPY
jgi:hypothetical protein